MIIKNKKNAFWILLFAIVFISVNSYNSFTRFELEETKEIIASDGLGYYVYLPAFFNNHDVLHQWYAMKLENGYTLNKYTCGVALLETPFFLIGKLLTSVFNENPDERNPIYMLLMTISISTYVYIGLCVIYFLIKRKFDKKTAWFCVIALYMATNLHYYGFYEPGQSHAYSFFCFAMCWYFTDRYYEKGEMISLAAFGFFFSMATLIRPTSILIIFFFLFYETYTLTDIKQRIQQHLKNYRHFLLLLGIAILIATPQMLYWYCVTGKPVVFSYGYNHESFSNWKSPKIIQVLVGNESGWLPYTPIMILSLIGLYLGIKQKKMSAAVILFVFILCLYICSSWWAYTFSCAFGYRSFVEYYAILAGPMALAVFKIFETKNKLLISGFLLLSLVFIYVNLEMSSMYSKSPCWDGPDWHWDNYFSILEKIFTIE